MSTLTALCADCKSTVSYLAPEAKDINGVYLRDYLVFNCFDNGSLKNVTYFPFRVLCHKCHRNFFSRYLTSKTAHDIILQSPMSTEMICHVNEKYAALAMTYRIGNYKWRAGNSSLLENPDTHDYKPGGKYDLVIPPTIPPSLELVAQTLCKCCCIFFFNLQFFFEVFLTFFF